MLWLNNSNGFEHITDSVVEYREQRCRIAQNCDYQTTGECALRAAGMQDTFPEESF